MEQRLNTGNAFLWVDEEAERLQRVRAGEIVVSPVGPLYPKRVPAGLIHDWVEAPSFTTLHSRTCCKSCAVMGGTKTYISQP